MTPDPVGPLTGPPTDVFTPRSPFSEGGSSSGTPPETFDPDSLENILEKQKEAGSEEEAKQALDKLSEENARTVRELNEQDAEAAQQVKDAEEGARDAQSELEGGDAAGSTGEAGLSDAAAGDALTTTAGTETVTGTVTGGTVTGGTVGAETTVGGAFLGLSLGELLLAGALLALLVLAAWWLISRLQSDTKRSAPPTVPSATSSRHAATPRTIPASAAAAGGGAGTSPTPGQVPLGNRTTASAVGDPHLRTFDNVYYDFQGAGEFVLVREKGGSFEIQGRYQPLLGSDRVSGTTAVAMRVGTSRVAVYLKPAEVQVDGKVMAATGTVHLAAGTVVIGPDAVGVEWTTGERAIVQRSPLYLGTTVGLPASMQNKVEGLLGNFDDQQAGDLAVAGTDERIDPKNADRGALYDRYGESWRVTPATSLFDYAKGQSPATFVNRRFPYVLADVTSLSAGARASAQSTCKAHGVIEPQALEDCILDVAVTGSPAAADAAASTQPIEDFQIAPGDHVTRDVPGPGAGRIGSADEIDAYRFHSTAGQTIGLEIGEGCDVDVTVEVLDPTGTELFTKWVGNGGCHQALGPIALPTTGTYTVAFVGGNGAVIKTQTGDYDFTLLDVPTPRRFDITPGEHVSTGNPDIGAGAIDAPFDQDEYRFHGSAGQAVALEMGAGCGFDLTARILDPNGKQLFTSWVGNGGCNQALGPVALPADGTYTIIFSGGGGSIIHPQTGNYDFTLLNVPKEQTFDIGIGQHVAPGRPGPGAGRIATPFDEDDYRFHGTAGEHVSLRVGAGCGFDLTARILDPNGKQLFTSWVGNGGCNQALGPVALPADGTYTIIFSGGGGSIIHPQTGNYDFTLLKTS